MNKRQTRRLGFLLAALGAGTLAAHADVLTQRYDTSRSGVDLTETKLTTSNVNSGTFGKLYSFAVDGFVYGQPLYLSALAIPGQGTHNVVFVATMHDSVYAFDADTGTALWQTSFINPAAGITSVPIADKQTSDLIPDTEVGVFSTMVLDPVNQTLFAVANTKENGTPFYRIHALDITTGRDKVAPVAITATVSGSGAGSSGGMLSFNPAWHLQRAGLLLANGVVYVGFGSSSDNWNYHGWLIGYRASDLAQVAAFSTTPNSIGGGVWAAGTAPALDAGNNIYFSTGNGGFDGQTNFGDSYVKLATGSGLQVADYFAPFNQAAINNADLDIATVGLALLPDAAGTGAHPHIAIGSGKDGTVYVLDRDNLGHFNSSGSNPDSQIIQEVPNALGIAPIDVGSNPLPYVEDNYSTATYYQGNVYWAGIDDRLKVFSFSNGLLSSAPVSQSATSYPFGGAQAVVSANGTTAGSAIVWAVERGSTVNVLHAYDATNVAHELYNSSQASGNRDQMGLTIKFVVPTVANGQVFVGSRTRVDVFGLLSSQLPQLPAPTLSPGSGTYPTAQSVSISDSNSSATIYYTTDGTLPTTSSPRYTGPIQVSSSMNVSALAVASGFTNSPVVTASYTIGGSGGAAFVQGSYADPAAPQSTVTVSFPGNQHAGDLNVAIVGWNDSTATVTSVTDTAGNTYALAVGPTVQTGTATQAIYYARNITGASPNTVTVQFSAPARFADVRILEYSGLDTSNPLDVTAASQGTSATSTSGSATTTVANELLVAGNLVQNATAGAGSGFTSRMITSPDSDIAEDSIAGAPGSYSASAPLTISEQWIMQMAAFRPAGAALPTPTAPTGLIANPTSATTVDLEWFAATETGGTIGQYLIERCQGNGCSTFVQVGTSSTTSFGDTGLTAGTAYIYRIRASDLSGNTGPYSATVTTTTIAANAPTPPSGVGALPVSPTEIDLSWTASTPVSGATIVSYTIQRCTGNRCIRGYATVGTSATTSFKNTGLASSTTYTYIVSATDSLGNTSAFSSFATGTTLTPSAPTAPTALSAMANGSTEVDLSWGAATESGGSISQYLIERCQGSGCSSFVQIGTSSTTAFSNTGLTGGTSYTYRVRAQDSLGTDGPYSGTASAATAAPTFTAPSGLTATAASSTQINLSWSAATETGGTLSGYLIERCQGPGCSTFTQVGTASGTTFNDIGLSAATTYSYRVRATDAAGNDGPYSTLASATTSAAAPAPITFVQVNSATPQSPQSSVSVRYTAAQGAGDLNIVVVGWNDSTATIGTVTDSSGNVYSLAAGPTVQSGTATQAIYYAANIVGAAANANTVKVTFNGSARFPDIRIAEYSGIVSTSPVDKVAAATGSSSSSSSGPVTTTSAKELLFAANLVQTGTTGAGSGFTKRLITPSDGDIVEDEIVSSIGTYTATAPLSSGQWLMQMVTFRGSGSPASLPSAPSALTATATGSTEVDLSWGAATESGGSISQYLIERCQGSGCSNFTQIATSTTTSFNNTGLSAATAYSYRVRAQDTTGNTGPYSNTSSATTQALAAPTAPTALTATATGSSEVDLTWGASTESGGSISQYLIERCQGSGCSNFTQIATSTTTSFNNTGLSATTAYSYRVRAQDTTGNSGPYSNTASATTQALAAPTAPTALTATANGSTEVDLSWGASTESGGSISQYLIERCQGSGCSNFTQIATSTTTSFNNTGLTGATAYSYRVRAQDAVGSDGPYSGTASAVTAAPTFTAPSSLTAAAASGTQINLSWSAATETGGTLSGYLVERCQGSGCSTFAQVGTTSGTGFNDIGLSAATTYSYRVRATDVAGNTGPYSSVASATTNAAAPPPITFVQVNSATPQSPQSSVSVRYTAAQGAGDLNIVVVGWNDSTATIGTVTDSSGNVYSLAAGPTVQSGTATQAIYYAPGIVGAAANANTVTVTFNGSARYADIRIVEYSGLDTTSPLDQAAGATGNSGSSSSGPVTTTVPNELIFGANLVQTGTSGSGSGFTQRLITATDGDIVEDEIVSTTGTYTATAPMSSGQWIMQIATFRRHP